MSRFDSSTPGRAAAVLAAIGAAIVFITVLPVAFSGDFGTVLGLLGFTAWALLPYGVLLLAGARVQSRWAVAGAGAAAIAAEVGVRLAVFVFPRGSTAAIALVFSPVFILVL